MTLPAAVSVGDPITAATVDLLISATSVAASGSVSLTPVTANVPVSTHVTFPTGRFSAPPMMSVTGATSQPQQVFVSAGPVTATGADIYLTRTNLTTTTVYWLAIDTP